MQPVQTLEHNSCVIQIIPDECPENPRKEYDHVGKMLYASSRYLLGDEIASVEEMQEIAGRDDVVCLPVFAYIHGSVSLSTSGFSCPWDSGQCGIIFCELSEAKEHWQNLEGDELREAVRKCLVAEVEEFSKYLSGEVYGYVVKSQFDEDSCWGFYSIEDALESAKEFADAVTMMHTCSTEILTCNVEV